MAETEIRHLFDGSSNYSCIFDDVISTRLRDVLSTRPARAKNAQTRLEETQAGEPEYFWEEPGRSNLLTFIYWTHPESRNLMDDQISRTMERYPDNIAAHKIRLRVLLEQDDDGNGKEAKSILQRLATFNGDTDGDGWRQTLLCEGEVAFALAYLGPAFYGAAIDRYQALIDRYRARMGPDWSDETTSGWQFHLAQAYNRMLNKYTGIQRLMLSGMAVDRVYRAIVECLEGVLETDSEFYKGKAMIELADAFKKCRRLTHKMTTSEDDDGVGDSSIRSKSNLYSFIPIPYAVNSLHCNSN